MMAGINHANLIGSAFDNLDLIDDPPSLFAAIQLLARPQSVRSIPVYLAPLRDRIANVAQRHSTVTARLDVLCNVPALIQQDENAMYTTRGMLTAQKRKLKTLEVDVEVKHVAYLNMKSTIAKRLLNKGSSRRQLLGRSKLDWEATLAQKKDQVRLIEKTYENLQSIKSELAKLKEQKVEYNSLHAELDNMNDGLFAGPTPEFSKEDVLEWEHNVMRETARLLQAETNQEKRARQHLKEATLCLQAIVKDLQKALQCCIDVGVASNQKYTKQVFVGASSQATVRATTSLILNAKTNSGKYFTTIAKARGSQALVNRSPDCTTIEFYLLPGQRSAKAVDEKGLHRSLEKSYSQSRACESYLRSEISLSLDRQKKLAEQVAILSDDVKSCKKDLNAYRRRIVEAINRGDEASLDTVASRPSPMPGKVYFSTQDLKPRQPIIIGKVVNEAILNETVLSHTRNRSLSETDPNVVATVAMVAVTKVESPSERLRKEAVRRLRGILAKSVGTPESEELFFPI